MGLMKLRKAIAAGVVKLTRMRGYEIIPTWRLLSLPLITHLRTVFEQYGIEYVMDVGANSGQFRDLIRQEVGFRGQILSFEPVRQYAQIIMAKSRADKAWRVYDCALGSVPGEATINVTRSPGLNSFLSPRTDKVAGFWQDDSITHAESVKIRTLDDVLEEQGIDCKVRGVYLKLDTQGFDLEVLKGATKSLQDIRALQTEASIRPIYEGMPNYLKILDHLSQTGFDVSGIFPVLHDDAMRLIEFDCVLVNSQVAEAVSRRPDASENR